MKKRTKKRTNKKTGSSVVLKRVNCWEAVAIAQLLIIVLPLYFDNYYFNIVEAKANALTSVFAIALILIFGCIVFTEKKCPLVKNINFIDAAVIFFIFTALISCLTSGDFKGAFWGSYGWGIGGFILLSFGLVYLFLSRNFVVSWKQCIPGIIVACAVSAMTLAHSLNIDVLNLHSGIYKGQLYTYKSTLGNMNAHNGFICLLFPLGLIAFCDEKNPRHLGPELVFVVAILIDIVFACSDGVYLGIGLCAFLAIPFVCQTGQRLSRAGLVVIIYGILLLCSDLLPCFAANSAANNGLVEIVRSAGVSSIIIVAGVILYACLRVWPDLPDNYKVRYSCIIIFESALLFAFLYFAVDTARNFSDAWGTRRGLIWRTSLECFKDLSPMQKVFGIGLERQEFALGSIVFKFPVHTCHSEPIQILLTMGIAGLATWFVACVAVIASTIRYKIWNQKTVMFSLSILAYLGQSFVHSAMATNIGVLCLMLSCFRGAIMDAVYKKPCQKRN